MCKANLSSTLVLVAAFMACAASPHAQAQRNELTTAATDSKPHSTGDVQNARGNDRRQPARMSSGASLKTLQAEPRKKERDRGLGRNSLSPSMELKSLDDSPEARLDRQLVRRSFHDAAQLKSGAEQNQLTTSDGSVAISKPIHPGDAAIVMIEGQIQAKGEWSTIDGQSKPMVKPAPGDTLVPNWTRISPGDMHVKTVPIYGWTIFSLQADNQDAVLNVYIYDKNWDVLAEFDSTGCGAFLQVEAQVVTVVIHNSSMEYANKYMLHVFD